MKANPDRYNLLFKNKDGKYPIKVSNKTITNSQGEKLLGIGIA